LALFAAIRRVDRSVQGAARTESPLARGQAIYPALPALPMTAARTARGVVKPMPGVTQVPLRPPSAAEADWDRAVQRVTPLAYRMQRKGRRWMRRAMRKPRSVSEGPNLLPLLIQVLASFSKADGVLLEEEIDSSLGFLRYDYPQAVYSELRMLFRQALYEQQDLSAMAQKLAASLSVDRKIMLGVQLYDLISQAGLKHDQVVAFYSFMSQLGMAAQAIDIVYQLNASEDSDPAIYQHGSSPLEALSFGTNGNADVTLKSLADNDRLLAFRYHDLILLKNYSGQTVSVRGRPLARGGFCRIYPGQRILVGDQVLTNWQFHPYLDVRARTTTLDGVYAYSLFPRAMSLGAEMLDRLGADPHVWLDPIRYALIVAGLAFGWLGWTVWTTFGISVVAVLVRTSQVAKEERA
jgi:hypothetical protein